MRVLTVRQPWAWAIIHGGKDVENRTRSLGPYRGLVAIHAGLDIDLTAWDDATLWRALPKGTQAEVFRNTLGAVIGVVDLTGTHKSDECEVELQHVPRGPLVTWRCSQWAMPDHHHLELANPRPLSTPVPARGRLGLWRPDADLETAIREQVGGAR